MLLQVYVLVASFVKMSGNALLPHSVCVCVFWFLFLLLLYSFCCFYMPHSVCVCRLTPSPVDKFALRLNMSLLVVDVPLLPPLPLSCCGPC